LLVLFVYVYCGECERAACVVPQDEREEDEEKEKERRGDDEMMLPSIFC